MLKHPLLYVWLLLIGLFGIAGFIHPGSQGSRVAEVSSKGEAAKQVSPGVQAQSLSGKQDEAPYRPDCERPKDHNDADVCLQQRVANAAEQQNRINSWALVALIATLLATLVAAVSAWRTVRTMRDTASRELRAYLNLDTAIAKITEGDLEFVLSFKNFGQTPAYKVSVRSAIQTRPLPLDAGIAIPETALPVPSGTIGPGAHVRLDTHLPRLEGDDKARLANEKLGIFYLGHIEYVDAFGVRHITDFCQLLTGTNLNNGEVELFTYHSGNDST